MEPGDSSIHPARKAGERRRVAVLFADLAGFTGISEAHDAEEIADFLHILLRDLSAVIERHGGFVDKYIGDAIMALFGAPVAHEDDLARAIHAGLALVKVGRRTLDPAGNAVAVRVSIHHGEVVAGTHGAGGGVAYTVTGDPVNTASRLQAVAPPGAVLVSDRVYRVIAPLVEAHEIGVPTLKGKREQIRAWVVDGVRSVVLSRAHRGPFVGRATEAKRLETMAEEVQMGEGRAVVLEGEAGLGKSRLVQELVVRLAAKGWRILQSRGEPLPTTPYGPIRQILRQALGAQSGPGSDQARRTAAAWVSGEPELEREVMALLDPTEVQASAVRNPELRPAALARVFRALAAQSPTMVVFEDLHWFEQDALDLLFSLAARAREASVLLLMTSRAPLDLALFLPADRPLRITLDPLDPKACRSLAVSLAEGTAIEADELARRSGGNPLFLEELVSAAAEDADRLPDSIHALLQSRLDRIPAGPRSALRLAAILGLEFPREILQHLCERESDSPEFSADVQHLLDHRFLIRPEERTLAFRHALVQEVAYGNELRRERRRMHESAAEAIEESYPTGPEIHPLLAHHYGEAQSWSRALPHLLAAGRGALQQYAVREAGRWLEKAAGALKGNEASLSVEEIPGFLRDLTECRLHRGEHMLAQEAADELVAASRTAGSDRFLSQAHLLLGQIHWSQSRSREAREEFERGLAVGADAGDEKAELLNACGVAASLGEGDEEAGERLLLEALATWKRSGNRLGQAKASVNLANLMVRRERLVEALEWYDRTLELGRAIPDRMVVTINLTNRGMVQFWRGKYGEAERCLRESLELARELGLEQHAMQISEDLGRCRLAVAELREALGLFRAVATRGEAAGSAQAGWAALYLGRTYFAAFETKRAVEYWQGCRRLLEERPDPELEGELLLDEGRVARVRGDRTIAAARFREALEAAEVGQNLVLAATARSFLWLGSAEEGGTIPPESESAFPDRLPLVTLLRFQRGRALRACERHAEALETLASAAALTDTMGAARLGLHAHLAAENAARQVGSIDRAKEHGDRARELIERRVQRLPPDVSVDRFRRYLSGSSSSG